jgi:hypothetical protein
MFKYVLDIFAFVLLNISIKEKFSDINKEFKIKFVS